MTSKTQARYGSAILVAIIVAAVVVVTSSFRTIVPSNVAFESPAEIPTVFEFVMVTDLDLNSKDQTQERWFANFKYGRLERDADHGNFTIHVAGGFPVYSHFSHKGRGMELSELVLWNGKLYTVCDYTGLVHEVDLVNKRVLPRYVVLDGDGTSTKPCKLEWATVKDGSLYVGSIGKEWVTDGRILHHDPMWVHRIEPSGNIVHENWADRFNALRVATNASHPGYMIHEAVTWLADSREWLFLPRKVSHGVPYAEHTDEVLASNIGLLVDEHFTDVQVLRLGDLDLERGFSAIARLPGTNLFAALKVLERAEGDVTETYFGVFDLKGRFYTQPHWQFMSNEKYEGLEFVPTRVL